MTMKAELKKIRRHWVDGMWTADPICGVARGKKTGPWLLRTTMLAGRVTCKTCRRLLAARKDASRNSKT